jgi:hypothetical protein
LLPPGPPPLRRWAFGPEARFRFITGDAKKVAPAYGYGFAAVLRFWIRPYLALQGIFSFDRFQRTETITVQLPDGGMATGMDTTRLDYSAFVLTAVFEPTQARVARVRPQFFAGAGAFITRFYTPLPLDPPEANATSGGVRFGVAAIAEVSHRIEAYLRFEYDVVFGGEAKVNGTNLVSNQGGLSLGFLYSF